MKAQKVNNPGDMEGFNPPNFIMTTARVVEFLKSRDTSLPKMFPGIEVIVVPDSQWNPEVFEKPEGHGGEE